MNVESNSQALTLAVIDDHEVIALGVRQMLASTGVIRSVLHHRSVSELVGTPDVVLLDLRLCDGTSVPENLSALTARHLPVVVYTSADDPVLVRQAIAHGALAIVRKSESADTLVSAITAAARGEVSAGLNWASAIDADEDFVATHLSDTEAKVLSLYACGVLADTIARRLELAPTSINTYVNRIRSKYRSAGRNVESRVDLFLRAAEDGLVSYFGSP